ncbi:MAG: sulfur transferase domain-containing protein [Pseudobdellovibrionaceae bacterium]
MNQIDEQVYVGGTPSPEEVSALAANGIKAIICNRPDHEDPGQPDANSIKQAAEDKGLTFVHIPQIAGGPVLPETLTAMEEAVANLPRPLFIYCRSGGRATKLYEMVSAK